MSGPASAGEGKEVANAHGDKGPRLPWDTLILCGAVLLPFLVAGFEESLSGAIRNHSDADLAILEYATRNVTSQMLGPYSQFGFRHPGPMLFWVLSVPYWFGRGSTTAMHVGAAVLNVACMAGVLVTWCRRTATWMGRSFALVVVAIFVGYLSGFLSDAVELPALAEIWNPLVTIVPFAAFCAACVAVSSGDARAMVPAAFLHAFLCQSHLGYVPVATGLVVVSTALLLRRRPPQSGARTAWLIAAGFVSMVCWALPIWDELHGSGNAGRIARFFMSDRPQADPISAGAHAVRQLQAPVLYYLGAVTPRAPTDATGLASVLTIAELGLLLGAVWLSRKRRPLEWGYAVLALVALTLALMSARHLDPALYLYPTAWFGVVGLFGWAAAFGDLSARFSSPAFLSRPVRVLCFLAVLFTITRQSQRTHEFYARFREAGRENASVITALSQRAERLARSRPAPLPLVPCAHDDWGLLAAVVLELDKRGVPVQLDPETFFMFGAGQPYAAPGDRGICVSLTSVPHRLALFTYGHAALYAPKAIPPPGRLRDAIVWLADSRGVYGAPTILLDRANSSGGTSRDSSGVVVLKSTDAFIELGANGDLITGVDVLANANDEYSLEASTNGRSYQEVAHIPTANGSGLRWRTVQLRQIRAYPLLRLRPALGDRSYSLGAISVKSAGWGVAIIQSTGIDDDPGVAADGEIPPTSVPWNHSTTVRLRTGDSSLTALLPGIPVERLDLALGGPARYRMDGSIDCKVFTFSTWIEQGRVGPAIQSLSLAEHHSWRCIRLSAAPPFGAQAIGEITPQVTPKAVVLDIGTSIARSHLTSGWSGDERESLATWTWAVERKAVLEIDLDERVPYELSFEMAPHVVARRTQHVVVRLNDVALGQLDLGDGMNGVQLTVPRGLARRASRVAFEFAYAIAPSQIGQSQDTRPLAALLERIAFIEGQ